MISACKLFPMAGSSPRGEQQGPIGDPNPDIRTSLMVGRSASAPIASFRPWRLTHIVGFLGEQRGTLANRAYTCPPIKLTGGAHTLLLGNAPSRSRPMLLNSSAARCEALPMNAELLAEHVGIGPSRSDGNFPTVFCRSDPYGQRIG